MMEHSLRKESGRMKLDITKKQKIYGHNALEEAAVTMCVGNKVHDGQVLRHTV